MRFHVAISLLLAVAPLSGCGSDDDRRAALRERLDELDHVASFSVDNGNDQSALPLDQTTVTVTMDDDAAPADLRAALSTAHQGLDDLAWADTQLEFAWAGNVLHSDSAAFPVDELLALADFVTSSQAPGETITTTIVTDWSDHGGLPFARAEVSFHMVPGSDRTDVLPRFDLLTSDSELPGHTSVQVVAADGSGLGSRGRPPVPRDRRVWLALQASPLPVPYTVLLTHFPTSEGQGSPRVRVSVQAPQGSIPTDMQVVRMMRHHFRLLRQISPRFGYALVVPGRQPFSLDSAACDAVDLAWQTYIDDWIAEPFSGLSPCAEHVNPAAT